MNDKTQPAPPETAMEALAQQDALQDHRMLTAYIKLEAGQKAVNEANAELLDAKGIKAALQFAMKVDTNLDDSE